MLQLRACMPQLKIPHTTTKRSCMSQLNILHTATKTPHAATKTPHATTKTQCSQINIFIKKIVFIGVQLFYNVVLVSTVQRREVEFPVLYSRFLLVTYVIPITVYMSIPIHPNAPLPRFPLLVSIHLFSTSVPLFLPCKPVHLYRSSRFHIYVLYMMFVFLFLTYFTQYDSLQVHPCLFYK